MNANQPEPVMNASYLAGSLITLIKLLMVALVTLGFVDLSDGEQVAIMALVAGIGDFAIIVATMRYRARNKVTPVSSPQIITESGKRVELVREDTHMPPSVHP